MIKFWILLAKTENQPVMTVTYGLRELSHLRISVKNTRIRSLLYNTLSQLGIQRAVRGVRAGRKVRQCKGLPTLSVCPSSMQTPSTSSDDRKCFHHIDDLKPIPVFTSYR